MTIEQIQVEIKKARHNCRRAYKNDKALRANHLRRLATSIVKDKGTDNAETIYQQLITVEQQREDARLIRAAQSKIQEGGLSVVTGPDRFGQRTEFLKKEDMERTCLKQNLKTITQVHDTPCYVYPLSQYLGNLGNTIAANDILKGKAIPPRSSDKCFRKLIPHLIKRTCITDAKPWTTEELAYRWRGLKEFKASGKS